MTTHKEGVAALALRLDGIEAKQRDTIVGLREDLERADTDNDWLRHKLMKARWFACFFAALLVLSLAAHISNLVFSPAPRTAEGTDHAHIHS